jgi:hypothetical protein
MPAGKAIFLSTHIFKLNLFFMARLYDNVVMKGMSGIIGDMLLFSQRAVKEI